MGRYRRRIIGWGAVALVGALAAGSAVSLARVEDDLQRRVAAALDGAGVDGVTVSFSGQDGTLRCAAPLADPDGALDAGAGLRGVRDLELDASCLMATSSPADDDPVGESPPPPTATTSVVPTTITTTTIAETTTSLLDPAGVLDILVDDPQFSVFENALRSVGLDELLGGEGPFTIFAPTDDAFAALGPNFNAALASNPDALETVLRHHIVTGDRASEELAGGPLMMLDGTTIEVDTATGLQVVTGPIAATVIDPDLEGVNGVVHVIDQVLVPADVDVGVATGVFTVVARYEAGRLTYSGTVASVDQRRTLLEAGAAVLAPGNVVDQLVVDVEASLSDEDAADLARLAAALPPNLVVGEVLVGADGLFVSGVYVDAAALAAIEASADEVGAAVGLTERPLATTEGAAELEKRLNAIVAADPIRFAPGQADLAADAPAVLDRVASLAKSVGGVTLTIEGHTDSDGVEETNLELSSARAGAVLLALVARGVPAADLSAIGFGSSRPVLVGGVEDKDASRRVEFVVEKE